PVDSGFRRSPDTNSACRPFTKTPMSCRPNPADRPRLLPAVAPPAAAAIGVAEPAASGHHAAPFFRGELPMPTALAATSKRRAAIGSISLLLLLMAAAAPARAAGTVFLEELTWTELRDLVKAGTTTILVPIGGTEQSGPDMALGKHNVRARALSER